MSIWSLYICVERWLVFRKASKQSLAFAKQATEHLKHDRPQAAIDAANKYPRQPPGPRRHAPACSRSSSSSQTSPLSDLEVVEAASRAIERATLLTNSDFKKGIGSLATIATTAPFIGLFGTVIGIINAFRGMALTGSGGIGAVSAGIAEALVTTALGLVRRHPGGLDVQLLHQHARALPGRDVELRPPSWSTSSSRSRRQAMLLKLGRKHTIGRLRRSRSDINVTPLVDVCLVLLIIFMVVTPHAAEGRRRGAAGDRRTRRRCRRARSSSTVSDQARRQRLRRPELGHRTRTCTAQLEEIHANNPDRKVVVKADRRLKYKEVRKVMRLINEAGFTRRRPGHREEKARAPDGARARR